jgi:ABC-type bacteriocin/lantibiotic exporter with double-glycine peptidase domain
MKPASLLKFDGITFGCAPSTAALMQGFDLEIGADSVTAILGPNGAGKTTLLHLALGWLKPQSGRILPTSRTWAATAGESSDNGWDWCRKARHTPF